MKDQELLGKNAYLVGRFYGTVHDFYLGQKGGQVRGIVVARSLFKSKPVERGLFTFGGGRYTISPEAEDSKWKPSRRNVVKHSRIRFKEVFAGPGWKIGRLESLDVDTDRWMVTGLDVHVEHPLLLRDVGMYAKLYEEKSVYGAKHFYKDAYFLRPDKIVEEMLDSDKARFLTDSGDSSIRGLGESTSIVSFPSTNMVIHESGTVILPINPREVQQIVIDMVNKGAIKTKEGRKNIIRDAFLEYYTRNPDQETHVD